MAALTLDQHNRRQLAGMLDGSAWTVACLCAEWCDVCKSFRPSFDRWAAEHPQYHFVWIDIEDQADLVGDIDIENFPTLLIQRGDLVAFFGTVLPDIHIAKRLMAAFAGKTSAELQAESCATPEHQAWQKNVNLRQRLP